MPTDIVTEELDAHQNRNGGGMASVCVYALLLPSLLDFSIDLILPDSQWSSGRLSL
jgi:hypothetical protein